jgi:hypothetical protein
VKPVAEPISKASHRNRNLVLGLGSVVLLVLIVFYTFPQVFIPNVTVSGRPTSGLGVTVVSVVFTNEYGKSFSASLNPDGLYYVTLPNGHGYTVHVTSQIPGPEGSTPGGCTTGFTLHSYSSASTFSVPC